MVSHNRTSSRSVSAFVAVLVAMQLGQSVAMTEKDILIRLYNIAGGKRWANRYGWEEASAERDGQSIGKVPKVCSWYGVRCLDEDSGDVITGSETGVTELNLSGNQLSGKISKHLYDMPSLKRVDLKNNQITDAGLDGIPEGDDGAPLEKLILSENQLTSLRGIENARSTLEELHVNENDFKKFPDEVFKLHSLKTLMFTHNDGISEPLPSQFGEMKNLRKLLLWYNGFTGTIPTELGKLKKLEEFAIDENKITGTLPKELGYMYNLQYLSIQNFEETSGRITGTLPLWEDLVYLKEVYLDYNGLTGAIPEKFLKHSNVTDKNCYWGFDQNSLQGTLPSELKRFEKLKIDLRGNRISGVSKDLCKMKKWMNGNVEQFGCDAILCSVGAFTFAGRQESKDVPCKACEYGDDGASFMGSTECVDAEGGQSNPDEQQILVKFALNTGLGKWKNDDGWADDLASVTSADETSDLMLDYCSWHGVECNAANEVEKLKFPKNGLKGKVTKDIFHLKSLKELDLSGNDVHLDSDFSFGFLGRAKGLEKVYLDETPIESWDGIGEATNLRELTLDNTALEGPLPDELFQLTKLKVLSCQFCGITGPLPKAVDQLSSLQYLNFYGNLLTGKIHSQIGSLTSLRTLDLSENLLHGTIPAEINNLQNLEEFSVHQASAPDEGLSGPLPAFDNLPNIRKLRLDENRLTGSIPENFLAGISDKAATIDIGLGFNLITGSVPASLGALDKVNIELIGNQITSIDPRLCEKSGWQNGEVGKLNVDAACDAILCPVGTYSVYGMASKTIDTCEDCPGATFMGTTTCTEEDESKYSEKKIIKQLYIETGGPDWTEAQNWTVSGVGVCNYQGITCSEGSHDNEGVTEIDLTNMGLSGTMPSAVWALPHLKSLVIPNNAVTVSFKHISNAQKLKVLNIASTNTASLDGLAGAPASLRELYLDNLDLTGTFPDVILDIGESLKILKLDFNHFSGAIPSHIDALSSLEEFWCYANDFTSTIPSEIGNLSNLKKLVMGENMLSGFLPEELGDLRHLEVLSLYEQRSEKKLSGPLLDFSDNTKLNTLVLARNAFKGEIPPTFLDGLSTDQETVIDLSFNHLSGKVPQQLSRFDALFIDLVGNKITELPSVLCQNGNWMHGKLGSLPAEQDPCDAIMCPIGHFNELGRLNDISRPCRKCTNSAEESPYFGSTHCGFSERAILVELYSILNGDSWARNQYWMDDNTPICKWQGVGCKDGSVDKDEGVESLSLAQNKMDGGEATNMFSPLFWQLPHLKELDIKDNKVRLNFDQIGLAKKLENLAVSTNGITDISGISAATKLKELHLTDNGIDMPLEDTELLDMTWLEKLFISYNSFRGTLPSRIGEMTNLKEFWCYKNNLQGQLPSEIGLLTEIEYLVISENLLTGTLPTEMNELHKLKDLALFSQHGVDGQISGKLPSFSKLKQITVLDLEYNQLSGTIPDDFLSGSTVKDQRVRVALNHNYLAGAVPSSLIAFDNLDLEVVGNQIEAIPDALCDPVNHGKWMDGMVGQVGNCAAIACPPYTYYENGRQWDPAVPCTPCPDAPDAFIGHDSCVNANEERDILMQIYTSTNGEFWVNNKNWMNDRMPICSWDRVFCGLGNESKDHGVVKLDLQSNQLDGKVPSSVYNLPLLEELNLKKNYDAILSFQGIQNAQSLEILYLSEIVLESMEGLGKAPALRRLHLTGCGMSGPFPQEFFDLATTLQELYIAYNDFSGTLPKEIGSLTSLSDFYAYNNNFSGRIPKEIWRMHSLRNLVLAENLISGQLPHEMSKMTNLGLFSCFRRSKDGPKLRGTLPPFDENPKLTDLYLDHNEIEGTIPTDFLASSSQAYLVNLASNELTGNVPPDLADLAPFQLELENNQISGFPMKLCDAKQWQQGDVGLYGCDAFMCKPGSYSKFGRQNTTDSACMECDLARYWGSTTCGGELPSSGGGALKSEYAILMELYLSCGGSKWANRDNWAHDDIDVCNWHGISCTDQGTVDSIRLGANNLVGTPPKSLFDLPDLEVLWLYSNPITFSFTNIGSALKLYELRLDSTNLKSVAGISSAQSLEILNLRFNKLRGSFPQEIMELKSLISLQIGDNDLDGTLPGSDQWGSMKTLEELRLGVNHFSGRIPDFKSNPLLSLLDLSWNAFSGEIPSNFLIKVPSGIPVQINLANNRLQGPVPEQFDRFDRLIIYLRGNQIETLPATLCDDDNGPWNKGDVSRYSCNGLLCPPGTYNELGRQHGDENPCLPCGEPSKFYGQTSCGGATSRASSSNKRVGWVLGMTKILASGLLALSSLVV